LISVSFGATITRVSEKEVSNTFVSFLQSIASLGYNWPNTIVLFLNAIFPSIYILIGAIIFQIIYYNTVIKNMVKYEDIPKEYWAISKDVRCDGGVEDLISNKVSSKRRRIN